MKDIENIFEELKQDFKQKMDKNTIDFFKHKYLGKTGKITLLNQSIKDIDPSLKKEFGIKINELKKYFVSEIATIEDNYEQELINKKLLSEKIDVTLPGTKILTGTSHPIEKIIENLEDLFISMGYDVVEGPEIEQDLYNFELLNLPKGHPARDAQDTFYVKNDEWLLRSQTSPVQARTMIKNNGENPIRIICPGKTYRRDEDDATHSHQFTQMEGLLIDKNISLSDLKGTFDIIAKRLFGDTRKTRFRPSYYPFTEPSVELDINCFKCEGKGCNICKHTGWITVGGAGMVNPIVLKNCGYNPEVWNGFAFGFGIERLTMLKYGINDVRFFYSNYELNSFKIFDRSED